MAPFCHWAHRPGLLTPFKRQFISIEYQKRLSASACQSRSDMEVDASRTAASSVLNTYPHRTFQAYHSSSPSLCTAPAPMSPGTYPGSNNDLADRSYMARPDEPRATASSDRAHASSSRNYWPRFSPPSTAHHPTRSETWPPSRTHPSASPAGPLRLPSLTTIIPSVDAHRSGSEIQRSPTASFSSSQSLPASLPPIASLGGGGGSSGSSSTALPRLPPILQVEKQQVTTSATQAASASRRRNEAHFVCPVPGCGSTFTRRFNLRGIPDCG